MVDSGAAQDGAAGQRCGTYNYYNNNNNNRSGGRRGRGGNVLRSNENRASSGSKFEGSGEPSLKKFIFDLHGSSSSSSNMFMITQREISRYYGRTAKEYIGDLTRAVDELQLTMPTAPARPEDGATQYDVEMWKIANKEFHNRTQAYKDFKASLCSIALGQCTEVLLSRVRSNTGYRTAMDERDGIAMMVLIRNVMSNMDDFRNKADALCELLEAFCAFKMGRQETLQQYYDRFISLNQVLDRVGGNVVLQGLIDEVAADRNHPTEAERALALERLRAVRFIRGTGDKHSRDNNCPTTVTAAYHMLQGRQFETPPSVIHEDATFATVAGDNGILHERINCHSCGQRGHFSDHCPVTSNAGANGNVVPPVSKGNISFV